MEKPEVDYKSWAETLEAETARLTAELAARQAFKDYVHKRLDDAGVPTHPDGPHSAAGCRIGDRLDFVFMQMEHFKGLLEEATHVVEASAGMDGYVTDATAAGACGEEREHVTDGSPCWCDPEVIHVEGKKHGK